MPTYRVTQLVKNYEIFYVEATSWEDAKQQVEDGDIQPNHIDDGEEIHVVFVDSMDGDTTFYEE